MSGYGSFATMDKDELREISRKAGVASGAARRRKREAIEREKVENAALREMREEVDRKQRANLRTLRQSIAILKEAGKLSELHVKMNLPPF